MKPCSIPVPVQAYVTMFITDITKDWTSVKWERKKRYGREGFPNLVLIIEKATDADILRNLSEKLNYFTTNRISREFEEDFQNVVVVVTHACSLVARPFENYVSWKSKRDAMGKEISNMMNANFDFELPVVWIENKLEDTIQHEKWTDLPDKTRQPTNLFVAMMDVLQEKNDTLGMLMMEEFFPTEYDQSFGSREMEEMPTQNSDLNDDGSAGTPLEMAQTSREGASRSAAPLNEHKGTMTEENEILKQVSRSNK